MRKQFLALLSGALVLALSAGVGISIAAGPPAGTASLGESVAVGTSDNLEGPLAKEQSARRAKALELLATGKIPAGSKVAQIGKGRYVQLAREDTDKIFVVLVEFGNERYPNALFQDKTPAGAPASNAQRFDGPLHNEIPQPDRKVDNSTLWQADYDKAHYVDMYFNRMAKYYETQSSGRYSVQGEVTDWVKVPFNEALYGRNYCGSIVCPTSRSLVRDALAVWVKNRLDAGQDDGPDPELPPLVRRVGPVRPGRRRELRRAGRLHRPLPDRPRRRRRGRGRPGLRHGRDLEPPLLREPPGRRPRRHHRREHRHERRPRSPSPLVPNNATGVWVGDYTMQPENGGLGVFAHEYGHDLGLPDLYDTSGNTGGAENSTAFWTLMSSGANIGDGGPDGIGDNPTDLGAWEKLQLGWLDSPSPRRASPPRTGSARRRARPGTASRASSSSCHPSRWPPRSSLPRRAAGRTGAAWATTSTTR